MKNALIPVISLIGLQLPLYIGGLGDHRGDLPAARRRPLLLRSPTRLDYPVVQSVNLIIACHGRGPDLLIDLSYAFLDPRIRYR